MKTRVGVELFLANGTQGWCQFLCKINKLIQENDQFPRFVDTIPQTSLCPAPTSKVRNIRVFSSLVSSEKVENDARKLAEQLSFSATRQSRNEGRTEDDHLPRLSLPSSDLPFGEPSER